MTLLSPIEAAVSPYLIWIKVAAFILALATAAGVSGYVVHNIDVVKLQAVQLADSKAATANVQASLAQLQGFIGSMHAADADYSDRIATINSQFATVKQELSNATHATPLPLDCRPDAGRLRVLTDAVAATRQGAPAGK